MTKFFLLIVIIVGAVLIGISYFFRSVRNIFSAFTPNRPEVDKEEKNVDEVVYKKDNVVVMKGDAGKNNKND